MAGDRARPAGDRLGRGGAGVSGRSSAGAAEPGVRVHLTSAVRALFPGAPAEVVVEAGTVAELVCRLDARWPGMRDRLCDSRPAVRRHINIFVDGGRAELETPLRPGSDVYVFTAMSGG